jgi:ABC-2 type transport system ATP-binding protein
MQNEFILCEQLSLNLQGKPILSQVNFTVAEGDCVAIIGANGSGKTSLLKLIAGILRPTRGKIHIAGMKVNHMIGYAPDTPPLYNNDSVYNYLSFIAQLKGLQAEDLNESINHCLASFELSGIRNTRIGTLSKGTQQRINLAQAILAKPKILILDEPTTALDAKQCENFCLLLKQLKAQKITLIIASHQYTDVIPICDYMLKLQNGLLEKIMAPISNHAIRETDDQLNYST